MFAFFLLDLIPLVRRIGRRQAPPESGSLRARRRVPPSSGCGEYLPPSLDHFRKTLQFARTARAGGLNIGQFAIAKTGRERESNATPGRRSLA